MDHEQFAGFTRGVSRPLHVVTAVSGEKRAGCVVGFGTQVSLKPPRMMMGISVQNHTHQVTRTAEHVAVHLLGRDQIDLARLFGGQTGDEVDKFDRCEWQRGPENTLILSGCPRVMVGRIIDRIDLGDHTGLLLAPVSAQVDPGPELLGVDDVEDLEPGHSA